MVSNALRLRGWKPVFTTQAAQQVLAKRKEAQQNEAFADASAPELDTVGTDAGEPAEQEIFMEKKLTVEGMMCQHCVAHVKKALESVEGVSEAVVDLAAGTAVAKLTADVADDVLTAAVVDAGYEVKGIE